MASTNRRFASRSKNPIARMGTRAAGDAGSPGRRIVKTASRISTSGPRAASSTQVASAVSWAWSTPTKNEPNPTAATSASRTAARPVRCASLPGSDASRPAKMTPAIASTIPPIWSVLGRSPDASPTTTGMTVPVADTGATMLIVPMASAR